MLLSPSQRNRSPVVNASLRDSLLVCWQKYQLAVSWTLLVVPLAAAMFYSTTLQPLLPYLFISPISIFAGYLIYRSTVSRLKIKTDEVVALSKLHLATAEALATAIDAKDQVTHCHVRRVQVYAARMGEVFGLSDNEISALKAGALLHDIGKLAVPPHILNKPGRLTPAEFEKMKIHTVVGAQILSRVDFPYPVVPIIRHHHERWDGRGYPDRLKGEQIPITARIISVVDCFDSVREDRPFRRGMTIDEATALLRRGSGIHFDPHVVNQFLRHLSEFDAEIAALGLQPASTGSVHDQPMHLSDVDMTQTRERGSYMAYDQIKKAHGEVYALYEIARTFGTSLDLEHTLESMVDKVGHVVPFDTCVVYFYDELKGYATARHAVGKYSDLLKGRCIAPGEGVTGFALANRSAVNQLHPSLDFTDLNPAAGIKFQAMASLPLFKDDLLLGALSVYSNDLEQYTHDHMRLLETVTKLASDALANAMQHAEAESHALTDAITGLPNSRSLSVRFEEEAARARRTGRSFQVVMLDLDEFKNVNDSYGHKLGDKMLREVASLIQNQLREYDFLCRYAGDEFVALVQEVVGLQVDELCLRIENVVSKFSLPVGRNKEARVGISIGTATFATDGDTLDQLLNAADDKMYRMKSIHRLERSMPPLPPASESSDVVPAS
ncbi:MAG TPA: diguanylate cyclase [Pyrinomonadaceae bacterium]|jgi:diguanylate cyclase (GGDEF)-like protein/putative nucleotidyltransferase with HDIG domain|nr:diguanylate cyclase [Pyrinomonadaceae bacterium]